MTEFVDLGDNSIINRDAVALVQREYSTGYAIVTFIGGDSVSLPLSYISVSEKLQGKESDA